MCGGSKLSTFSLKTTKNCALTVAIFLLLLLTIGTWNKNRKLFNDCERRNALSGPITVHQSHLPSFADVSSLWINAADNGTASSSALSAAKTLRNFTIVTAYLNIGQFSKGNLANKRNSSTYHNWMWPYRFIQNGVVAYFDDASMAAAFTQLRRGLPTKVIMVQWSELWAFTLLNRTRVVFSQPDYPKNHPKSTVAEYVAAMHAKYELLARAVRADDPFDSSYVAWMDLGIYRQLPSDANSSFMLRANPCLRDEAVMFALIFPMVKSHTPQTVMRNGHDWVGGGFFVARRDVMTQFCEEYARRVESYLNQSLANHDQSVLLAMYLPNTSPRPSVPVQAIIPSGADSPWFFMALQSRRDALEAQSADLQRAASRNATRVGSHVSCTYEVYT